MKIRVRLKVSHKTPLYSTYSYYIFYNYNKITFSPQTLLGLSRPLNKTSFYFYIHYFNPLYTY